MIANLRTYSRGYIWGICTAPRTAVSGESIGLASFRLTLWQFKCSRACYSTVRVYARTVVRTFLIGCVPSTFYHRIDTHVQGVVRFPPTNEHLRLASLFLQQFNSFPQ